MKKLYTIFAFLLYASFSKATVHLIAASGIQFIPSAVTAVCGDTMVWGLANINESHTTTSTSVPAGAAGWGANLNATSTSYTLVLTVPGTYSYQCTPHSSMGMKGTITVTCPSGVPTVDQGSYSAAYPMPFTNRLTIETSNADMITFYNMVGEKIKTLSVQPAQMRTEISTAEFREGIYFYSIIKEGVIVETRKIVKN